MYVNVLRGTLVLSLLLPASVFAALPLPVSLPANGKPTEATPLLRSRFDIEKLEVIQGETILLEAQALKAKAQVAANGGVTEDTSQSSTVMAGGPSTLPRISEIAGSDTLSANLIMPDNSEVHVWKGQSIAGTDMTVTKITSQGVIVTHADGSTVSLPMDD
ncbi:TPA: type IV pilus biogenesis protein PilP [Salmonella enterica subsp. salamae serovar 35:g,m,s,t:-]|nr:type IV pilus biogenesis protein PilP [Salmonella enterica subsp. salamae serovar 35:g,m,s,t:-]HCA3549676.1 type IV pilus biogenesis protein PilP [Salmonella enterica subsp. salamae serovar 35:g,m,s,t:-]